jgi:archaeal flagellar protein FlaJ
MNEGILWLAGVLGILFLGYYYYQYQRRKDSIENVPRFFQEVYNNCSSGMSLVKAVKKSKNADYGLLTPDIRNLCLQIEWGVPFPVALKKFSKKINDPFVSNLMSMVNKAAEFSPNVGKSMEDIYKHITLTKELEKQRSASLFPQLLSLYLIYFVLLVTVFVLFRFFIPSFGSTNLSIYKTIFSHLIIMESILSGLTIGKITEGSFRAGAKHVILLLFVGIFFIYLYGV